MRRQFRVRLVGTWERPSDGQEWAMHQWLRKQAGREGFWADFHMFREKGLKNGVQLRDGTFEASGVLVWAASRRRAETLARRFVRDFVQDMCCGAPKLTFDEPALVQQVFST